MATATRTVVRSVKKRTRIGNSAFSTKQSKNDKKVGKKRYRGQGK